MRLAKAAASLLSFLIGRTPRPVGFVSRAAIMSALQFRGPNLSPHLPRTVHHDLRTHATGHDPQTPILISQPPFSEPSVPKMTSWYEGFYYIL